jgi:hypothetical protein
MNRPSVCPCTKKGCPRHGDCAACEEFHKTGKRPPYCEREKGLFHKTSDKKTV